MLTRKVRDIMTSPVVTARPGDPLTEVIKQIMKGPFSGLPVVNDRLEVLGMVTELDVLRAMDYGDNPACSSIMSAATATIEADKTVLDALKSLLKHNITQLPVTEGGRLAGIIARRDILRMFSGQSSDGDLTFVADATRDLLSARHYRDVLRILVRKMGEYFEASRCSVLKVDSARGFATVLAAFEDESISNLEIDLRKYPEIKRASSTGEPVIVYDVHEDDLMRPVKETLKDLKSILVFPVISNDRVVGTLELQTRTKKPFGQREIRVAEMLSAVAADAVRAVIREERLRELFRDAEKKVVIDDLTGLYNRRFLKVRLEEEFTIAKRYGLPLSCVLFDIDRFKDVNDACGHAGGDKILRRFASCLRQTVRKSDFVVRYGGEEFVLLLPMTDIDGAMAEARRIKDFIDNVDFPYIMVLTVSAGVASFPYPGVRQYEDLIRNADGAMYEAKRTGRNRIVAYGEDYFRVKVMSL